MTILIAPLIAKANEPTSAPLQSESVTKQPELGETVWLEDGQGKFLAIFTADQNGQPKGAAIILHDANHNPDWPDVIRPVRTFLPLHGWATVSIQLPPQTTIDEYISQQPLINIRIQKATEHLQSLSLHNIALIGYGTGAMAATAYVANQNSDSAIRGFIGISLSVIKTEKTDDYLPTQLERIKVPILDIYGGRDLDSVTNTAMLRSLAAKRSSTNTANDQNLNAYKNSGLSKTANDGIKGYISYRQIVIHGADHEFNGLSESLNRRVLGWLERHTKGTAITSPR